MKTNVNLFIALVLCAVMGGLLYFLVRPAQDDLGWNPNEMYGELGARSYDGSSFTNATLSGASNGGVALSMPHTSFSLRTRVSPTTYSPLPISNSQSPIANRQSPISQSPISYTTSSAEYHSFGGGSNGNMGSAGTFRASTQSPISNSQSPIAYSQSPIAYTSVNTFSSYTPAEMYNAVATVSGYDAANAYSALPTRNGVRGRQNLGQGPTVEDSWLIWLSQHTNFGSSGEDGWYFTHDQLYEAWEAYCDAWNETMGKCPTWEEWLAWFMGDGGSHSWGSGDNIFKAYFVPVGNILPLLLMALLYMVILFVKRNKTAQL